MRLSKNSISKVSLTDILRRRRKTLNQFLNEFGIVTYELLVSRCNSMGVVPPSEEKFLFATGGSLPHVSSPAEGVVIVDSPIQQLDAGPENEDSPQDEYVLNDVVDAYSQRSMQPDTNVVVGKKKKNKF